MTFNQAGDRRTGLLGGSRSCLDQLLSTDGGKIAFRVSKYSIKIVSMTMLTTILHRECVFS